MTLEQAITVMNLTLMQRRRKQKRRNPKVEVRKYKVQTIKKVLLKVKFPLLFVNELRR